MGDHLGKRSPASSDRGASRRKGVRRSSHDSPDLVIFQCWKIQKVAAVIDQAAKQVLSK
jgi:hypothetical protein